MYVVYVFCKYAASSQEQAKEWPSWCDGTDNEQAPYFPYQKGGDDHADHAKRMAEMTRGAIEVLCTAKG
jgi:hypothetical protein